MYLFIFKAYGMKSKHERAEEGRDIFKCIYDIPKSL